MNLNDKQHVGFVRAMAREVLAHNPNIKTVDDAIVLAEELLVKTHVSSSVSSTHSLTPNVDVTNDRNTS